MDMQSKGSKWFRQESPFQIAAGHYIHKFIMDYGPFTFQGINLCITQITTALTDHANSPYSSFPIPFLQMFVEILKTDATDIYNMVPHPEYIPPTMAQLNQNVDPNANYPVKEIA